MDIFDFYYGYKINQFGNDLESLKSDSNENQKRLFTNLAKRIDQLVLLNQATAEFLEEKLGITNKDIVEKMNEIDLRDGVKDGRYTAPPKDCPECGAKISREFDKCLFCGYVDEESDSVLI